MIFNDFCKFSMKIFFNDQYKMSLVLQIIIVEDFSELVSN